MLAPMDMASEGRGSREESRREIEQWSNREMKEVVNRYWIVIVDKVKD